MTPVPSSHPGQPSAAESLRESLASLIAESQALRSDVHGAELARKRANQINLGVLAVLALFVGLLVAIGWQNNQVIQRVDETNDRVASCTTPGGTCYEQGRARTSGAISAVVQISIFVSQCGRLYPGESGPAYDAKLQQCVMDRLAQAQAQPTPALPAPSTSPSGG
jgi:hypothetical protein